MRALVFGHGRPRGSTGQRTTGWKPAAGTAQSPPSRTRPRHRCGSTRPLHPARIVRSYAEIYLHLVWGTWDRHPLLVGERVEAVYRAIHHECVRMRAEVIAIGGMEDHVHLLVRVPASLSASDLVKQVKGASS